MTFDPRRDFPVVATLPADVQEKVATVWEAFLAPAGLTGPSEALNDPRHPEITLADHHEQVARTALATLPVIREGLGIDLDEVAVVTGGLLIDVDKLERYGKAEIPASVVGHGKRGAAIAEQHGLDEVVLDIVANHSPGSKELPETPEGVLISYVDFLLHDILQAGQRGPFIVRVMKPGSIMLAIGR